MIETLLLKLFVELKHSSESKGLNNTIKLNARSFEFIVQITLFQLQF